MSDRPVTVKLGGTTIAEQQDVLREIADERRARPVVVVHGGGKRLTEWLERLGVKSHWNNGRRVTDEATLEVFLAVISGVINAELIEALMAFGARAVGARGIDDGMIRGPRAEGLDRVISEPVADASMLRVLLDAGYLPVVTPMGLDPGGRICNVNADDAAAAVSASLGGELVLLTDTDGVRGADGERIPELTPPEAARLIDEGVIAGGMVPKVGSALRALAEGSLAERALIADGRIPRALHRALHEGAGTGFRLA
ncbi:MAG: acetylglutamate kinase [Candidatus Limnocylindrales bacterium]